MANARECVPGGDLDAFQQTLGRHRAGQVDGDDPSLTDDDVPRAQSRWRRREAGLSQKDGESVTIVPQLGLLSYMAGMDLEQVEMLLVWETRISAWWLRRDNPNRSALTFGLENVTSRADWTVRRSTLHRDHHLGSWLNSLK